MVSGAATCAALTVDFNSVLHQQKDIMKNIWSLCEKVKQDVLLCCCVCVLQGQVCRKNLSLRVCHAFPGNYFWSNWGIFPFQRVVEGLRLPQSRCEEMRKAGISKYPI